MRASRSLVSFPTIESAYAMMATTSATKAAASGTSDARLGAEATTVIRGSLKDLCYKIRNKATDAKASMSLLGWSVASNEASD
jgi:hypothetical protein